MKDIKNTIVIKDENETEKFAIKLASVLEAGDVVALIGALGVGKTALTKHIARALDICGPITSPTFTIVKEYHDGRLPLYHFDVYRISDSSEMYEIGVDEYLFGGGVCVIEWADLIEDILPEDTKYIYMEYGNKMEERIYKCTF